MLDSPKRYSPRQRPDSGPRPDAEGHGEAPIRRPVHLAQNVSGQGHTDWEQGIIVNGHADEGPDPARNEPAAYPRVVSQQASVREAPAPYEAAQGHPGKGQPIPGPGAQMVTPPGADYGAEYAHPPAAAYAAPPPRSYAPRAGPTVYAPQPYAPPPYAPPAQAPTAAPAARLTRQAPRPRQRTRDQYLFGRSVAYVSMGVAWLLIACGVLGPVQIALGVVATRLGTAGSVLVAGLMAVGGLFMLLAAHAVLAIFDQSDAMQSLAGQERARRAEDGRKDGA